jgi:hypothetical protein
MSWHSFIFSNEWKHRLQRHLLFWLLWWLYFTASFYHYEQSGLQQSRFEPWNLPFLIKSLLLLAIHIFACYYFMYYIIPNYLLKRKYKALLLQFLILGAFILLTSYYVYSVVVPFVNTLFDYKSSFDSSNIWWTCIVSGLLSAPKVICAASVVLLLKRWYVKQKEKERLEKEKLLTDLQLLKAQIHPEFLFSSLENIHSLIQKKDNDKAAILLLKLADILSYILYESDRQYISLEKEIKIIKDYLSLGKTRMDNKLELNIAVKGTIDGMLIIPLLLFSLIENSFSCSSAEQLEANWLNVELQAEEDRLTVKLINGKGNDTVTGPRQVISNASKRLDYFYPGNYELRTIVESEMMMTYLEIGLKRPAGLRENNIHNVVKTAHGTH